MKALDEFIQIVLFVLLLNRVHFLAKKNFHLDRYVTVNGLNNQSVFLVWVIVLLSAASQSASRK